jgi:hypothetical protein
MRGLADLVLMMGSFGCSAWCGATRALGGAPGPRGTRLPGK